MAKLPVAPFEKIIKDNGGKRVSFSAAEALSEITGDIASQIAKSAAIFAEHAERKTVVRKDIELARKHLRLE
ncbi:MAG: NFYB/HAP3 family transcription factor subunit [Candidatus Aenigmarchaeota archaeon]|nr:NFYB/HAP3 family transcription factor subunit [Candidatus Aenigmarchaeota archaeon]